MKSWRSRTTAGLALGAALVLTPQAVGSASAAGWETIGGGPAVFGSKAECDAEAAAYKANGTYQDARCYIGANGWVYMEVIR